MRTFKLASAFALLALIGAPAPAQQPQDWNAAITAAVATNMKALQFASNCRYPQDVLAGFMKYDAALSWAAEKTGQPTKAELQAIRVEVQQRMQVPPHEACAKHLDLLRTSSLSAAARAAEIRALTPPRK